VFQETPGFHSPSVATTLPANRVVVSVSRLASRDLRPRSEIVQRGCSRSPPALLPLLVLADGFELQSLKTSRAGCVAKVVKSAFWRSELARQIWPLQTLDNPCLMTTAYHNTTARQREERHLHQITLLTSMIYP